MLARSAQAARRVTVLLRIRQLTAALSFAAVILSSAGTVTGASSIRKHIIGSGLGRLRLTQVTAGKIDLFLTEKEEDLSAKRINHLRGYLSRAFTMARRMEKCPRPNPVTDVPKRKVVKRLPDYLRPQEVQPLIAALKPKWKRLFATAI